VEQLAEEALGQLLVDDLAAEGEEPEIALRHDRELGMSLRARLRLEPALELVLGQAEPGRVEDLQVVAVDDRRVAAREGVACHQHGERAAGGQLRHLRDHVGERDVVAVVAVHGVQAGRPARGVVGLRLDLQHGVILSRRHE
jgi:hypothetical protein